MRRETREESQRLLGSPWGSGERRTRRVVSSWGMNVIAVACSARNERAASKRKHWHLQPKQKLFVSHLLRRCLPLPRQQLLPPHVGGDLLSEDELIKSSRPQFPPGLRRAQRNRGAAWSTGRKGALP